MKRSNWLLLLILAILIGAYFLIKNDKGEATDDLVPDSTQASYLIQETDSVLQIIRIYDNDYHIVEMSRELDGTWIVSLPTSGAADQSAVTAAESQLSALQIITDLGSVTNLADFGILVPEYTVKLTYDNGIQRKIEIGSKTPTNNGYYVQLDDGSISIVSQYSIDAIVKLIKNPPYPATPTMESTNTTP